MAFRDVVGHDRAVAFFRRTIASGRAGASVVLHGPQGIGRRMTAIALAQALNCPVETGEGCGSCGTCRRIAHVEEGKIEEGEHKGDVREYTHHADVHIIVPGREEIRIDEVRVLRQRAARRPFEGRTSVFIIDPAERMTVEASNALLKTLEEPPPTTCIVLIASDPDALLPTVRSRCRLVALHPLPISKVAAHLRGTAGLSEGDAALIASLTGGRIGRAMSFDLEAYRERREALLEVVSRLIEKRPRAHVLKDAEILGSRGEDADVEAALETLETLLRDAMILHAAGRSSQIVNRDVEDRLRDLARAFGARIPACLRRIGEARRDLSWNVNRQLLVEALLLDIGSGETPEPA